MTPHNVIERKLFREIFQMKLFDMTARYDYIICQIMNYFKENETVYLVS